MSKPNFFRPRGTLWSLAGAATNIAGEQPSGSKRLPSDNSLRDTALGDEPTVPVETVKPQSRQERSSKERRATSGVARYAECIVQNKVWTFFSVTLTIWALTSDDIRMAATQRTADSAFDGIVMFCLAFFSLEIMLSSIGKPDYFLGLFFFLDGIATMSLVFDFSWVSEAMEGGKEAKGGRTAKVGAGMMRMVRVLRLVRIVKLYKAYHDNKMSNKGVEDETDDIDLQPGEDPDEGDYKFQEQTVIGKRLSDLLTRKVIFMVLSMLMVLPYIDVSDAEMTPSAPAWGIEEVWRSFESVQMQNANIGSSNRTFYEIEFLRYIHTHSCGRLYTGHLFWFGLKGSNATLIKELSTISQISEESVNEFERQLSIEDGGNMLHPLVAFKAPTRGLLYKTWEECQWEGGTLLGMSLLSKPLEGVVDFEVRCPDQLRPQEVRWFRPQLVTSSVNDAHIVVFFDIRAFTADRAIRSIITTFFVCIVLMLGSVAFSSDANTIVLQPVEVMMAKVNRICADPLIAMKMSDQEFQAEEKKRALDEQAATGMAKLRRMVCCAGSNSTNPSSNMETAILERTIVKLGSLLALGFGVAGVEIVSSNMKGTSTEVKVIIPGTRVDCIIGTTRIDNFSLITEALQSKVMVFVNQIAELVHSIVDQLHGAPNKNNGSNFLLIWRAQGCEGAKLTRLADMSVLAFVRIVGALHCSRVLARYRAHPGLKQLTGSSFRLNLMMGLHFGWAIEGAVGSEFKVDASYLSPTMSIVESVQRAAKVYDVTLVATDAVISRCSMGLQIICRVIDKVLFKGSKEPFELFTIDLDQKALTVQTSNLGKTWTTKQRFKARQLLDFEKRMWLSEDVDIPMLFAQDKNIQCMRKRFTTAFRETFKMGYSNYTEGEWGSARRYLTESRLMLGDDGPSRALLSFMEASRFESPANWIGVRQLEDNNFVVE